MWSPAGGDVAFPGDPVDEELRGAGEDDLTAGHGNQAEVGIQAGLVLRLHDQVAAADERSVVRQRVGDTQVGAEQVDERTQLRHRHAGVAVGAEQSGFDELGPGDGAAAGGFDPDDWSVGLPAALAAFEPVVQGALGCANNRAASASVYISRSKALVWDIRASVTRGGP